MAKSLLRALALFAAASTTARSDDRIAWVDPSLELYRAGVGADADHARLELCVRTRDGARSGSTSLGYPRYRKAWGRWTDCVVVGLDSRRTLRADAEDGPACFSVLVPADAAALELPIGGHTLEIPVADWLVEPAREEVREPVPSVDGDVPASLSTRPRALAVVLGVETYAKAPAATFADDDASAAARYFEKSLGIPAARIELLRNGEVTLGQLQRLFGADGWLARRTTPDTEIFVYFAGHGMAELEKFSPYLLPADADPDYIRQTALSVDRMIEMVAALGARRTTLFLDACFSGLSREGASLLDDARPIVVEQAPRSPAGLSIYSAGSRNQIVSALPERGHGIFSYYLFRGLAGDADLDGDRRVLAGELRGYLEEAVPLAARTLDREQTPGIVLADPEEVLVSLP